jgi:hypothetical protein
MKKHLHRFALLIGLILLAIAITIMISQTIGHKKASSAASPVSLHDIIRVLPG